MKLPASQHGRSVRGSVKVSQAGAGGRLEVDLLAKGASLADAGHGAKLPVGRLVHAALTAGTGVLQGSAEREGPAHAVVYAAGFR